MFCCFTNILQCQWPKSSEGSKFHLQILQTGETLISLLNFFVVFQLEEKIQQLSDMTAKHSVISLNLNKFKEYVKSPPRDYSFIVMFTAMAPSRRCAICQHVYDEYLIVANSMRYAQAQDNKLYFGMVDFDEGSDIFQMVNMILIYY